MRVDFESPQTVEVCGPNDTYQETEFVIGLTCTASSDPGCWNHSHGGWPSEAAEFELATISLSVPAVNSKSSAHEWLTLTYNQFCALVSPEAADIMIDAAIDEAIESGEF